MILFSPVGTADPITALGDGPMLHIVRHYRPTVVTLFFSPAVATFEEKDGRYTKAIERLVRGTRVRIVETQQTQVHRFDLFVPEFRVLLAEFAEEFPGEEILLNTSSGTPAMQSALVAINAFGIPATKAIQVSTPSRSGINNPGDREHPNNYDLDLMWDADEDNLTGAVNRCFEASWAALGRCSNDRISRSSSGPTTTRLRGKSPTKRASHDRLSTVWRASGAERACTTTPPKDSSKEPNSPTTPIPRRSTWPRSTFSEDASDGRTLRVRRRRRSMLLSSPRWPTT